MAALVCMVQTLTLLLHDQGWGVRRRTGPQLDSPLVRACVGAAAQERLLGRLYVGTPH